MKCALRRHFSHVGALAGKPFMASEPGADSRANVELGGHIVQPAVALPAGQVARAARASGATMAGGCGAPDKCSGSLKAAHLQPSVPWAQRRRPGRGHGSASAQAPAPASTRS